MNLDDLNNLEREARELDSHVNSVKSASKLLDDIQKADGNLFGQIHHEKSKLRNDGWTLRTEHLLLISELERVVNEHAVELMGIAERRLAAKRLDLVQRAAMKRALLMASITPVEVKS